MKHNIGIIAEDDTDIDVLRELIRKITPRKPFCVKKFAAHGSGKLMGKCQAWSVQLRDRGCDLLIVLHDLDERQEHELRHRLEAALYTSPIARRAVVIPVKEIESWLLSDHLAIERAMNLQQKVAKIPNPESIQDPKRYLGDIVYLKSGKVKRYLTQDNYKIAREIELSNLRRCLSFAPLEKFIKTHLTS